VSPIILYSIPAFFLLMILEYMWLRRHREYRGYRRDDTTASLWMGVGNVVISTVANLASIPLFAWVYSYRVFDLPNGIWPWLALFFAEDFCYYWFHRLHHQVRLLWAVHVNHHSSKRYNLSTALRQAWLTPLTAPWFWLPLALLGFSPAMIFTAKAWSLLYQFWLHTESIKTLGPLEWVLNTPSHHRVHHGRNVEYLDKNHAGILIIWDRLFGTFKAETAAVDYGLTTDITSYSPVVIAFHELAAIARDVGKTDVLTEKLHYVFAAPGWSHDGATRTAAQMQAGLTDLQSKT
jgi:sterol desaturase/sphingolipid hydroxylase (fatty acid hydroxylase superfamily)